MNPTPTRQDDPRFGSDDLARRLAILEAVTDAISDAVDLDALLSRALDTVVAVTGVDGGGIFLVDEHARDLRLTVHRGVSERLVQSFSANPGRTLAALTRDPYAPVIVRDLPVTRHRPELVAEQIRSYAAIPLHAHGDVLGVLVALSHGHADVREADVSLLVSIGKQIGLAVERARLLERERRRAQQMQTISEVSRRLGAIRTERELLPLVVTLVREMLGYESAVLFLLEPVERQLTLTAASGFGYESLLGYRLAVDDRSIVGWVTAHAEPLLANDVTREPRYHSPGSAAAGRAELAVPIRVSDRTLGVLDVQSAHVDAFHEIDIDALQTLAGQIAVAVENARLSEGTERALRRTRAFQSVTAALTESLDLQTTLERSLDAAMEVFEADRAALYFVSPVPPLMQHGASRNLSARYRSEVEAYYASVSAPPQLGNHASVYVEDASVHAIVPDLTAAAAREGFRSMLYLPLVHRGTLLAMFTLYHDRVRRYSTDETALAQTFADQAGIAIAHARAFEREQRAREHAATILDATRTVTSSLHLLDVLRRTASCIAAALGQQACIIWLLDESGAMLTPVWGMAEPPDAAHERALSALRPIPLTEAPRLRALLVNGRPALVTEFADQTDTESAARQAIQRAVPFDAYVAVPLAARDEVAGIAAVLLPEGVRHVNQGDIDVATAIARSAALAVENARLYEQAQRLAVSEERNRLARELHDSVTHSLFSMSMITQALPRLLERDADRARERIERLDELGRGALAEMRALLFELRPAALEDEGLESALRTYTAAFQSREGVTVSLEIEGHRRLSPATEETVFRVTQESLNNVAKHARATRVTVRLVLRERDIELIVRDDGVGFDQLRPRGDRATLGLTGMRERADLVGGSVSVESVVGGGTSVCLRVPT